MTSLSEIYYAEIHQMSFDEILQLYSSFKECFPYNYEMMIKTTTEELISEIENKFGLTHPETVSAYSNIDYRWSIYHPITSTHYDEDFGSMEYVKIGFKDALDAMQFRLSFNL